MNFKKLPKEKQKNLVGVVVLTLMILGAMGHFLIRGGYDKISALRKKQAEAQAKLDQMQKTVDRAKTVEAAFDETHRALNEREKGVASGDLYSWMHGTLRKFARSYKVEIPQVGAVSQPGEVTLLPNFPYKQSTVTLNGTGYYHELGRFVADFENQFPLMRIVNLSLDLNPTPTSNDRDKLAFRMDVVTLVKTL